MDDYIPTSISLEARLALDRARNLQRDAQRYRALRAGQADVMVISMDGRTQKSIWGDELDRALDGRTSQR